LGARIIDRRIGAILQQKSVSTGIVFIAAYHEAGRVDAIQLRHQRRGEVNLSVGSLREGEGCTEDEETEETETAASGSQIPYSHVESPDDNQTIPFQTMTVKQ
jgi:hypothetical protein